MPDIANYAYLWYKTENPFEYLSLAEYYEILEIVTTYSYPCYLSGGPAIDGIKTLQQKNFLLNDEIGFIRARMSERGINPDNITIIQIPRVLYDLFLLVYYTQTQKLRKDILINCGSQPGVATSSDLFGNFEGYKRRIADYIEKYTNDILELNHFIIRKIYYIVRGKEPKESYDDTSGSRRVQRPGHGFASEFSEFDEGDMSPTTFQAQKSTQQFLAKKAAGSKKKTKLTAVSESDSESGSDYSSLESSSASSAPETEPQSPFVALSPKGTVGEPAWLHWEPLSPLAGVAGVAQWPKFESLDSPDSPYGDSAPSVMSTMTE